MTHRIELLIHAVIHAAWVLACSVASGQVCQTIDDRGSHGTAVCVGKMDATGDGVFLTAGHVCESGSLSLAPDGQWRKAAILGWCADGPGRDIGLVLIRGYVPESTYRIAAATPAEGERVLIAGFAKAGPLRQTHATIRQHQQGWYTLSAAGIPGISGGPVLVGTNVVGIVTHNDPERQEATCTNAETILASLKTWGIGPGKREVGYGVGLGIGVQCGPFGCRPAVPTWPSRPAPRPHAPYVPADPFATPRYIPADPYASVPQTPGFPGWETQPDSRSTRPSVPPVVPDLPTSPDTTLRDAIEGLRKDHQDLKVAVGRIVIRGGERGEPGEAGPQGPPGRAGRDHDPAELDSLKNRVGRLEGDEIPVRVLDGDGKTVDERRYRRGETIELRLVPRNPQK